MNKKNKKLINNTLLFLIGNIGSKIIQFILVPLYTYTLTTSEYGITELVFTTINILIPIFSIQVADAFLRYGLDKNYKKEEVLKIVLNVLFIGSIVTVFFIPIFKLEKTLNNWLFFFMILLNLRMYRDIFAINAKVEENNKLYAIDSIIYTIVLCISNVICLVNFNMGIEGYFLSFIFANIISMMVLIIFTKNLPKAIKQKTNKSLQKEIILYSLPMIINSISWWITNASDRYFLQYFMTDSDVGIYSVAAKIPTILTTFIGIFNQAWLISVIGEYNEKDKIDKNDDFYSKTFEMFCSISFISCAILIIIVKPFMRIYVNENFFEAWIYSPWLFLGAVSSGIGSFLESIYYAYKKTITVTVTTVIGGVLNLVLNYFLIVKLGITGVAIATCFSWMTVMFFRFIFLKPIMVLNYNRIKLFIYFILLIIEVVSVTLYNSICSYIISVIICVIILYMEKKFLKKIINILLKKCTNLKNKLKVEKE